MSEHSRGLTLACLLSGCVGVGGLDSQPEPGPATPLELTTDADPTRGAPLLVGWRDGEGPWQLVKDEPPPIRDPDGRYSVVAVCSSAIVLLAGTLNELPNPRLSCPEMSWWSGAGAVGTLRLQGLPSDDARAVEFRLGSSNGQSNVTEMQFWGRNLRVPGGTHTFVALLGSDPTKRDLVVRRDVEVPDEAFEVLVDAVAEQVEVELQRRPTIAEGTYVRSVFALDDAVWSVAADVEHWPIPTAEVRRGSDQQAVFLSTGAYENGVGGWEARAVRQLPWGSHRSFDALTPAGPLAPFRHCDGLTWPNWGDVDGDLYGLRYGEYSLSLGRTMLWTPRRAEEGLPQRVPTELPGWNPGWARPLDAAQPYDAEQLVVVGGPLRDLVRIESAQRLSEFGPNGQLAAVFAGVQEDLVELDEHNWRPDTLEGCP